MIAAAKNTVTSTLQYGVPKPFFSVVIPLFNKRRHIKKTIESVLGQTYSDYEIVVINDGSTDGSAEIAESIKDQRLRVINQENGGVSRARNIGIREARGVYICFLDADDLWHEDYLAEVYSAIKDDPARDFIATRFTRIDEWTEQALNPDVPERAAIRVQVVKNLPEEWLQKELFITSCVTASRSILNKLSDWFPPGESVGEDMDVWFRLAELTPLYLVQIPLVSYREGVSGSLTQSASRVEIPPYLARMMDRALSRSFPEHLRSSTISLVKVLRTKVARQNIIAGHRWRACELLLANHDLSCKKWWFAWFALLFLNGKALSRWEAARIKTNRGQS